MEVHAHSHTAHDPDSHRGRKKWTHYFWEFLMLFLAVFCGFLAEYQLEHKIDKNKEKQLARLLYRDIKFDTAMMNGILDARNRLGVMLDSLSLLLNSPSLIAQTNDIYYLARSATRTVNIRFIPNDGTLHQLKNAGGLRLIHDADVADSIIRYDAAVRNALALFEQEAFNREGYRKVSSQVFDARIFDKMTGLDPVSGKYAILSRPTDNPAFNNNKEKIFELSYWIHYMKVNNILSGEALQALLQQAQGLLRVLQKEYSLK